jgi:hypothetical protein
MVEKHLLKGKDVWIRVDAHPVNRPNPDTIPKEYFTASYFFQEPDDNSYGQTINEDGQPKLFESPVAALSFARRAVETELS